MAKSLIRPVQLASRFFLIIILLLALHILAQHSYLFFHTLVELFSIIVAFSLFTLTWSSRKIIENKYLIIVGLAAFFIGALDLLHTLSYQDMSFFPDKTFYANQFWIATRFFESVVLLTGFVVFSKKVKINPGLLLAIYSVITLFIILIILYWKIFPVSYIEGVGQTRFKIISEYVIISILAAALFFLHRNKQYFETQVYRFLILSVISTIISEFSFTLYFSNTGYFNELGHIFKILSFYFIYKAVIETGFIRPGELLYRNLKISREEAEKYNKQLENEIATRDKLFSIIAHDLRSPFSVLLASSEMLFRNPEQLNAEQVKKQHKILYITSRNTFELLENLLQWTRMKAGAVEPLYQRFDINGTIKEQIRFFKEASEMKNIHIEFEEKDMTEVYADRLMIDTVLRNLISNAVKFTRNEGTVTISTDQTAEKIMISVSDTGIGIQPEDLPKIFQSETGMTTRGTNNEKGSGLGLQLCKEFVEKNNGKIGVESYPGKGSHFFFTLNRPKG